MAKVIFSSLIDDISGKFGGSIFKRVKSGTILRQSQRPANPRSAHQQRTRRIFNDLSGRWYSLTATQQSLWDHFASLSPGRMSGFNSYLKLNTRLLCANYSTLARTDSPPLSPSTPEHITGLSVESLSNTKNIIGWTSPKSYSYFTQAFFAVAPGYSFKNKEKWRSILTTPSASPYITHEHTYPIGTNMTYKVRTIDIKGRISVDIRIEVFEIPLILLYVTDGINHRLKKHRSSNLTYVTKYGSYGNNNAEFSDPNAIALDENYIYIADTYNSRIKKHQRSNFNFIAEIGSLGSGDNQFNLPAGIAVDDTHIFISDSLNNRIKKHLKSDLSYVAKFGSSGSGDDQFSIPMGLEIDDTHIYIADYNNHRIKKHLKSDLSYVAKFGSSGSGDDQFNKPLGLCLDDIYIYIADNNNNRIKKHLKSDLSYIAKFGTQGTGDNQFNNPKDIAIWPL